MRQILNWTTQTIEGFIWAKDLQSQLKSIQSSTIPEDEYDSNETKIKNINKIFADHLRDIASKCFKQTKPPKNSFTSKKPWFNGRIRLAKREFRKAIDATSRFPSNDFIRQNYYNVKGSYKRMKNSAKDEFFTRMNEDIESCNILN
jgi:hypothetical protein